MRNLYPFLLISLFISVSACTQSAPKLFTAKSNTVFFPLGDGHIRIRTLQYGDAKDLFFISLHDDEMTAIAGATRLLELHGGTLVKIENSRNRNIRFKLRGRVYMFDPNRIFSRTGIIQTLKTFGPISNPAIEELQQFARRLLQLLPPQPTCVIALHNNSDGKFSVTSYFKGNEREKDAKAIHLATKQDADDLFLTTDSLLFRELSRGRFNTVLQDNKNAHKDGSLSIYCGENNICYLNCETEHGRLKQYVDMVTDAVTHIKNRKPSEEITRKPVATDIEYNYQLSGYPTPASLPRGFDIYFGEKKIGLIKSLHDTETPKKLKGKMEIQRSFPLYDNMDFFLYRERNPDKIEIRIDPTRVRRLVDPNATIVIKVIP